MTNNKINRLISLRIFEINNQVFLKFFTFNIEFIFLCEITNAEIEPVTNNFVVLVNNLDISCDIIPIY